MENDYFASHLHGRRITRSSEDDQMIAGVAEGVAEYLDLDPTVVRVRRRRCSPSPAVSGSPLYPRGVGADPRGRR